MNVSMSLQPSRNGDSFLTGLAPVREIDRLEIVLKVTERCNINCTYCYMFNKGNEEFKEHPPYFADDDVASLCDFIQDAVAHLRIKSLAVILHGGEPMMFKVWRTRRLLQGIKDAAGPNCTPSFAMQTNAMLVSPEWKDVFSEFRVGVGVSLDGPAEYNDQERLDHQGLGTYASTVAGFQLLQQWAAEGLIPEPGLLCVIDPKRDSRRIYRHFRDDLNCRLINFILPIESHETARSNDKQMMGRYLTDLLSEWISDDEPSVKVRLLGEVLRYFSRIRTPVDYERAPGHLPHALISIGTNGELGGDDALKPLNLRQIPLLSVRNSTLSAYLNSGLSAYIRSAETATPEACVSCCWEGYCRAGMAHGRLINRYSRDRGFNNASVFCEGLRTFFASVAQYFVTHCGDIAELEASLERRLSVQAVPPIPRHFCPIPISSA
jgi:uncharacterized protein